jgi:hypothetical protein
MVKPMPTCPLTVAERAYRRAAAQVLLFVMRDAVDLPPDQLLAFLATWCQRLKAARDATDVRYLGHYLDEIRQEVNNRS